MRTEITLDTCKYSHIQIRRIPERIEDPFCNPKDIAVIQDGKGQIIISYGNERIFDEREIAQNETSPQKVEK